MIMLGILLIVGFFIPWVSWEKISVSGAALPFGNFFSVSENKFNLDNPFPRINFLFLAFWLIPLGAAIVLILAFFKRQNSFLSCLPGILTLMAVAFYLLFSNVLADLGVKYSLQAGIYIAVFAAIGIIIISPVRWFIKIFFIIISPAFVWFIFNLTSNYLMNEKFENTANTKADYTVNAMDMINEFHANDSLANKKYREKIIVVNGTVSAIERSNDSTVNIKFIDSTTGSYLIFPLEGEMVQEAAKLKTEDNVSLKGSCSGAVYSEILGAWFISFKRSVLNKK